MMPGIHHVHFVGIGGVGMSGIAEILLGLGYRVSGSDLSDSPSLRRLSARGVQCSVGHAASHVNGADVVVRSSAIPTDNIELSAARKQGIAVVQRAQMLAELLRFKRGIAVAGTHGKTTTSALVAHVLIEAGLDPSFVIGGTLNSARTNARLGQGDYTVVEADESDASFLHLSPLLAVVTNIDADHMETYGHDVGQLQQAFLDFLHRLPFYGRAILCIDDLAVRDMLPAVKCKTLSYGCSERAQFRAVALRAVAGQMHFTVQRRTDPPLPDLPVLLNLSGRHNVLNALAVIALAHELKMPDQQLLHSLATFQGVGRRFQCYGDIEAPDGGVFTLIDDYGHHPVEMTATLAAARGAFAGRRLVLVFQPHRYSRTRDCWDQFLTVMAEADAVLLTEVYSAGEAPLAGANGRGLAHALHLSADMEPVFVADIEDMAQAILDQVRGGDVVLCMGAGSIEAVPAQVLALATGAVGRTQEEGER